MRMLSFDDRSAPFIEVFKRTAAQGGYALEMLGPGAEEPGDFTRLKSAYRHMSPNTAAFELASFRRWFELAPLVAPDERVIHADSDLVIFTPWSEMPGEISEARGLVGSIGVTNQRQEEQINAGFSSWTGSLLASFCSFVVTFYETRANELADIYARQLHHQPVASISDMTLLYMWMTEQGVPFVNTNRILLSPDGSPVYIDHNIVMSEAQGVRFRMSMGRKSMEFHDRRAFFLSEEGRRIGVASAHLTGRNKILAGKVAQGDRVGIAVGSAYLHAGRAARAAIRSVYRGGR